MATFLCCDILDFLLDLGGEGVVHHTVATLVGRTVVRLQAGPRHQAPVLGQCFLLARHCRVPCDPGGHFHVAYGPRQEVAGAVGRVMKLWDVGFHDHLIPFDEVVKVGVGC